jgi:hypothetical protein
MGCDIHWYSETRVNGEWVADTKDSFTEYVESDFFTEEMDEFPFGGRDYWMFGLLNAVRTEWEWSFPYSTFFPEDASKEVATLHKSWDSDAHSASQLNRKNLKAKFEELASLLTKHLLLDDGLIKVLTHQRTILEKIIDEMEEISPNADDADHRLVFWFDN